MSVVEPVVVPLIRTAAPITGQPVASITVPDTLLPAPASVCAYAWKGMMKQKARRQSISFKVIENRLLFINKSGY
jgi:hypothetical protein